MTEPRANYGRRPRRVRYRKYGDALVVEILRWRAAERRLKLERERILERHGISSNAFKYLSTYEHRTRAR